MKGSITSCLAQLIETTFGKEKWEAVRDHAGAQSVAGLKLATSDVDDAVASRLIQSTCKILGLTEQQAADAFGEYWCCTYAPKVYKAYLQRFRSAREMILGMDQVHSDVTNNMANARPPRFEYHWEDENSLVVTYKSPRGMMSIYVGLARGVGKYFKEKLDVQSLSANQCRIRFLRA
jgi:hypothetical protein